MHDIKKDAESNTELLADYERRHDELELEDIEYVTGPVTSCPTADGSDLVTMMMRIKSNRLRLKVRPKVRPMTKQSKGMTRTHKAKAPLRLPIALVSPSS